MFKFFEFDRIAPRSIDGMIFFIENKKDQIRIKISDDLTGKIKLKAGDKIKLAYSEEEDAYAIAKDSSGCTGFLLTRPSKSTDMITSPRRCPPNLRETLRLPKVGTHKPMFSFVRVENQMLIFKRI